MIKKISAFTLVELITAVALIIVLSVISVPIYKNNTQQAKESEAYSLLSSIRTAQYAYYREYGYFLKANTSVNSNPALGVDARGYKYYTSFKGGDYDTAARGKYYFCAQAISSEGSFYLQYNVTKGHKIVQSIDESWK
ncbi:MAG: type II secretion system protein [Elusimicrobia bacterium]|nr:type II secretion system protein [Elusimicrobiota bacterium]